MALEDLKFKESDFVGQDVSSLPNQVRGQAEFVKGRMDNIAKNMIALGKFNELVDFLPSYFAPISNPNFVNGLSAANATIQNRLLLTSSNFELFYGSQGGGPNGMVIAALGGSGYIYLTGVASLMHIMPRATNAYDIGAPTLRYRTIYIVSAPNISCDSAGKVLVNNVDFSGVAKKTRSAIGSIPIADVRELIQNTEIREYFRYKNEPVNPDAENPEYELVVDEESRELGIFIDDLKDHPLFELIGRIHVDEDGKKTYSVNTMSYATIALAGAKDALNRLDKVEAENAGLKGLLVSKGICTQEEIENL